MLAEPHVPSLTIEASFAGQTAELVISGELDPAVTPVLSDMLGLVLGRHPRTLVLRMSGTGLAGQAAARVIADSIRMLPDGTRPVIYQRSPPVRSFVRRTGRRAVLAAVSPARPAATTLNAAVECGLARAAVTGRHYGDGAGRPRAG